MARIPTTAGALGAMALLVALGLSSPAAADMDQSWGNYDTDADGIISDDEFGNGLFGDWDADDDERIGNDEYGAGSDLLGDQDFAKYDADKDSYWNRDEFDTAYGDSGIYDQYRSSDGEGIGREEFATFYDDAGDAGLLDV